MFLYSHTLLQARDAQQRGDNSSAKTNARISLALNIAAIVFWIFIFILVIISTSASISSSNSNSYRYTYSYTDSYCFNGDCTYYTRYSSGYYK